MGHVAKVVLLRREPQLLGGGAGSSECMASQCSSALRTRRWLCTNQVAPAAAAAGARITATEPTPACPVAKANRPTISATTPTATPARPGALAPFFRDSPAC